MIVLVAALGRNRVIGDGGALPWHLPEDLARFKALTMGHPMIMGRSTFDSIGRALPGRTTIVLTRDRSRILEGAIVVHGVEEALTAARASPGGDQRVIVAGGGEIYRAFLPLADRLELTRVDLSPAGDTTFPEFDIEEWRLVSEEVGEGDPGVAYQTWTRRAPAPGAEELAPE